MSASGRPAGAAKAARPRDAIVVLGARLRPDGGAGAALERRVARGVALFRAGAAPALVLCGGGAPGEPTEAAAMRALAIAAGVDAAAVVVEDRSRTTLENALEARAIMAARGWESALVVTDRLHLPRALLAFRAAGVRASGRAAGGAWRGPFRRTWHFLAYEACALPWYLIRILLGWRRLRATPAGGGPEPPAG